MATADFSASLGTGSGAALQQRMNLLARRRNAQKMARALIRAAIPGVGLAALGVALFKFHIIPDGPDWAPLALIGGCLLWGVRNGLAARAGSFEAACDADRTLDWDDRLSSALAFTAPASVQRRTRVAAPTSLLGRLKNQILPRFAVSTSPAVAPTSLVPSLVDEAAARAQNLDGRRVYPLRFDRSAQVLTGLSVSLLGAYVMPDMPLFQTVQERKQVVAMQNAGEKLVEVAKVVNKSTAPKAEEERKLAQRLQKLGQKMVRGRMTKRAALTEMGELRQELKKAQQKKPGGQAGSLPQIPEALRQAPLQSETGRKVQEKMAENKWDEAAKALEELADKVEKNQLSSDEKKKAADDLEKVARDLKSRGGQANQEAAKQLENAAQQLRQQQQQNQQPQGQNPQNGAQQQQNQQQQAQQGQKPQPNGQQGQTPDGKKPQEGQKAQSGEQQPQGQNSQSQSSAQQGQQQQQQGGEQGKAQQGGAQQGEGQQQGSQQDASSALRNMAKGLRQGGSGGSNSQGLQEMLNKIRDAENQTGTNGGQQFGQVTPTDSSGECKGGDCRGSVTPGKELKASDPSGLVPGGPGLGPRNNAAGNLGGGVSKVKSARTGDKRRYADDWSNSLPKTRAQIDRLKGKWGGNGEIEQMPTKGDSKGGQVRTPYYEAYEAAKSDKEEAVNRDSVPPEYKQPVKDYFESIKP